jgi:PIN domain nuclease of toxin-antitoxin system
LNLLLDTHALLWFLTGSNSLSIRANQFIEDGDNAVWVSPASFWEIGIKISLGKYQLGEPLAGFMQREITQTPLLCCPSPGLMPTACQDCHFITVIHSIG